MNPITRRKALGYFGATTVLAGLHPSAAFAQSPVFPKGAVIRTLFKDYLPSELAGGATLFHEHLSLGTDFNERFRAASAAVLAANGAPASERPTAPPPPPPGPDPMRDVALMAEELRTAQREGVACLVDAGLEGAGVEMPFIREAARRSGVPVVKGAGFYTEPYYPAYVAKASESELVDKLIRQADEYPAGAFGEIGSWDEMTPTERKVFRAVGKAHQATNLPVFTHTGIPGKAAIEQLNMLEDSGVDPHRVAIGHLGHLTDPGLYVHRQLVRRGAWIGIDRQGGGNDAPAVPLVIALINAGFADHILISGDANRGYARPVTKFLPMLKAAGATDEVLHRIMVDNPRRFLAFVPKRPRKLGAA